MAPVVVSGITRNTFKPYAKLGKSNAKIQSRICELLFRLIQTDNPKKVRSLCKEEIAWLESENYKAATRTAYVSAYRKALQAWFDEHPPSHKALLSERETVKGTITQHCALQYLMAAPADYAAGQQKTKSKTAQQRDNLTGFNAAAAVDATQKALASEDWRELAVGLIMATQSRPSDMLSTGEFKAISKYRLEFTSRAKKRGQAVTGEIFCLVDTLTFIDAFSRLRREADVVELRGWKLKDIDSAKNATLNRAVRRIYGEIIPVPYGEEALSCKNLRAAGVNIAYWLHGRDNQSIGRFAELQLLHDNPSTAANYEDFYGVDGEGKRLLNVGILKDGPLTAKPKSEKRSTVSVDAQLREMIGDAARWGEGSHADRLERIIARAELADRLERQLARECEKRQALELQLKRLQEKGTAQPVRPEQPAAPAAAPVVIENEATGFEWRSVPNAELNGDRRHDAYAEKLRRSVESIQEYNAGLPHAEQFAITGSLLRQITKVKPGKVKLWTDEHRAELDSYNAGFHSRQNTGKPAPRSVIKWNEAAYGEYEW
ncbi:MAG: protelomerase family protein [Phormidesmis sp.]